MQIETPETSKSTVNVALSSFERYRASNKLERETIQKRTFTRWINSHISKVSNLYVNDLYCDLADGKVLKTLLEVLTGEKLPSLRNDTMGIYCLENLHKILMFLENYRIHLENIQPLDIYSGNNDLILGLIWIIILSFQVYDLVDKKQTQCLSSAPEQMIPDKRDMSDALLRWCQLKTADYLNVNIMDFSTSWKDGLAFNALIHSHRPDLFSYDQLRKYEASFNLNHAFSVAQHSLGIEIILDPSDLSVDRPDSRSVMTYVSSLYRYFSQIKSDSVHSRRLCSIIRDAADIDKLIEKYKINVQDLIKWIIETAESFSKCNQSNNLDQLNQQLNDFNHYKFNVRPKRLDQKNDLEVLLLNVRSTMRRMKYKEVFNPDEGETTADVDCQWDVLEKAENSYETLIKTLILNLRRLDTVMSRFYSSVERSEKWVSQKMDDLTTFDCQCEELSATVILRKMDLLNDEISSRESCNQTLKSQMDMLVEQEHRMSGDISQRFDDYMLKWCQLTDKYQLISRKLTEFRTVEALSARISNVREDIVCIMPSLMSFSFRSVKQIDALADDGIVLKKDIEWIEAALADIKGDYEEMDKTQSSADEMRKFGDEIEDLENKMGKMRNIMAVREGKLEELGSNWELTCMTIEFSNWLQQQLIAMATLDNGDSVDAIVILISEMDELSRKYNDRLLEFMNGISPFETIQELIEMLRQNGFSAVDSTQLMCDYELALARERERLLNRLDVYKMMESISELSDVIEGVIKIYSDSTNQDSDWATTELLFKQHDSHMDKCSDYGALIRDARCIIENDKDADNMMEADLTKLQELYANVQYLGDMRKNRLSSALMYDKIMYTLNSTSDWIALERARIASLDVDQAESINAVKVSLDVISDETRRMQDKIDKVNDDVESWMATVADEDDDCCARVLEMSRRVDADWNDWLTTLDERKNSINISYTKQSINSCLAQLEDEIGYYESFIESDLEDVDLSRLMSLRRRFHNFSNDVESIRNKIVTLSEQARDIREHDSDFADEVLVNVDKLVDKLENMIDNANKYQVRMQEANDVCRFLCRLDQWETWLSQFVFSDNVHNQSDVEQWRNQLTKLYSYNSLMESEKEAFNEMLDFGKEMLTGGSDLDHNILLANMNSLTGKWNYIEDQLKTRMSAAQKSLLLRLFKDSVNDCEMLLDEDEAMLSIVIPKDFYVDIPDIILELNEYANKRTEEPFQKAFDRLAEVSGKLDTVEIDDRVRQILQRQSENTERLSEKISKLHYFINYIEFTDLCDLFTESTTSLRDKLRALSSSPEVVGDDNPALQYAQLIDTMHLQLFDIEQSDPDNISRQLPEYADEITRIMSDNESLKGDVIELYTLLTNPENKDQSSVEQALCIFANSVESRLGCSIQSGQHASSLLDKCDDLAREGEIIQSSLLGNAQSGEETSFLREQTSVYLASVESYRSQISSTEQSLKLMARIRFAESLIDKMISQVDTQIPFNLGDVEMQSVELERLSEQIKENEPMILQLRDEITNSLSTYPSPTELMVFNDDLEYKWNQLKSQTEYRFNELESFERFYNHSVEVRERLDWIELQSSFLVDDQSTTDDVYICEWIGQMLHIRDTAVRNGFEGIDDLNVRSQELEQLPHFNDYQREQLIRDRDELTEKFGSLFEQLARSQEYLSSLVKLNPFFYELAECNFWMDKKTLYAQNMDIHGNFLTISREIENVQYMCERIRSCGADLVERCEKTLNQMDLIESDMMLSAPRGLTEVTAKLEDLDETLTTGFDYCSERLEYSRYYQQSREIRDFLAEITRFVSRYLKMCRQGDESMLSAKLMYKRIYYFETLSSKVTEKFNEFTAARTALAYKYSAEERHNINEFFGTTEKEWKALKSLLEMSLSQIDNDDLLLQFFGLHNMLWKWVGEMTTHALTPLSEFRTFNHIDVMIEGNTNLRCDISAYDDIFDKYIEIGRSFVTQRHPRAEEISNAILLLTTRRGDLMQLLSDREFLAELLFDVHMFATNVRLAEDWYHARKMYFDNINTGRSLDEVERLIKRHELFVQSLEKYSDIVVAVMKLTKVEKFEFSPQDLLESLNVTNLSEHVATGYIVDLMNQPADTIDVSIDLSMEAGENQENGHNDDLTGGHSDEPEAQPETVVETVQLESEPTGLRMKLKRMASSSASKRLTPQNTPPIYGTPSESPDHYEGTLQRKTVWVNADKKAIRRNWISLYVVLDNRCLYFYKNFKAAYEKSSETYRSEPQWELAGSVCAMADDYVKHSFVFRVSKPGGNEYLFQADSQDSANEWCDKLVDACGPSLSHSTAAVTRTSSKARMKR